MTWDDVLLRDDIVNGDIVLVKDGVSFQGQISGIGQEGDDAVVFLSWSARRNQGEAAWRSITPEPVRFRLEHLVLEEQEDRGIRIITTHSGEGFFYPIGHHMTLDPTMVQGLPVP